MTDGGGARTDRLVVLARAPIEGRVKTRLAAIVGARKAVEVYRRMAERTVAQARAATGDGRALVVHVDSPEAIQATRRWLGIDLDVRPQAPGDLGARMKAAFDAAFSEGAERVVLVGTDCPRLAARHLREAFAALDRADLVLGPATDGGYWLVAARGRTPDVFEGVPWSTSEVLAATERLAAARGLSVARLEALDDVDTAQDLSRYPDLLR